MVSGIGHWLPARVNCQKKNLYYIKNDRRYEAVTYLTTAHSENSYCKPCKTYTLADYVRADDDNILIFIEFSMCWPVFSAKHELRQKYLHLE